MSKKASMEETDAVILLVQFVNNTFELAAESIIPFISNSTAFDNAIHHVDGTYCPYK